MIEKRPKKSVGISHECFLNISGQTEGHMLV